MPDDKTTPVSSVANPTPGPWRNDEPDSLLVIVDTDGGRRIVAGCWGHSESLLPEGIANARLIAAAPDLLATLKALVEYVADEYPERVDADAHVSMLHDNAQAAITRATGETP